MRTTDLHANMALDQIQTSRDDRSICKQHPEVELQMICMECKNEPVCQKCISSLHNGHECVEADYYMKDRKEKFEEILEKAVAKMEDLDAELGGLKIKENKIQKQSNNLEGRIGARQKQVKDLVDGVAGKLIEEVHENHIDEIDVINTHERKLRRLKDDIEKTVSECKEAMQSTDIRGILSKQKLLVRMLNKKVISLPYQPKLEFPFTDRADDSMQIKIIFGDLSKEKLLKEPTDSEDNSKREVKEVTVVSEFSSGAPDVYSMSTTEESQVWMSSIFSRQVRLLSDKGKLLKTLKVDFPICDVSCSCEIPSTIMLGCTNNTIKTFLSNNPYTFATTIATPYSITAGHNVIVGLRSGQLVKYSKIGEITDMAECDRSGEKLVSLPHRIAESETTGDIAIVNWDANPNSVVVLDKHFNLKYRHFGRIVTSGVGEYKQPEDAGDPGLGTFFHPQDVCYDKDNNLVIADETCVFVVDSENGKLLGRVLESDVKVTSVTIDKIGNTWAGFSNGKVKIARYCIS